MRQDFHSGSRQLQVQSTLKTLKLTMFMEESDIASVSEGLAKLVDYIEGLASQYPEGFREDTNNAVSEQLGREVFVGANSLGQYFLQPARLSPLWLLCTAVCS